MIHRLLMSLLVLLLAACAQAPASFDYDTGATMPVVKTYALQEPAGAQSLDNGRIESALRRQLTARGIKEVPKAQADIWIAYRIQQQRKLEESGVSFGFGFGTGNVGVGVNTGPKAKEIIEGQLVVDAIDPGRQQVIWTAKANRYLRDSMQPEQRETLIDTLVTAMLAEFPPKGR